MIPTVHYYYYYSLADMNGIFYVYFHRTELSLKQPPQSDYNMQLSGNISSTFRSSFLVIAYQTTRVIALLRKTYSGRDLDNSEQFY